MKKWYKITYPNNIVSYEKIDNSDFELDNRNYNFWEQQKALGVKIVKSKKFSKPYRKELIQKIKVWLNKPSNYKWLITTLIALLALLVATIAILEK